MRASLQSASFAEHRGDRDRSDANFPKISTNIWEIQSIPFSRQARPSRNSTTRSARDCATLMREALPTAQDGSITYAATAMAGGGGAGSAGADVFASMADA